MINVGRGAILDEEALIECLRSPDGRLKGAALDVFCQEPLPKESPLWKRKDVIVSPHVSGVTRAVDVPDIVLGNYQRYSEGKPLQYQVDWSKGY